MKAVDGTRAVTISDLISIAGAQYRYVSNATARAAVADLIMRAAGLEGSEALGEVALDIIEAAPEPSLTERITALLDERRGSSVSQLCSNLGVPVDVVFVNLMAMRYAGLARSTENSQRWFLPRSGPRQHLTLREKILALLENDAGDRAGVTALDLSLALLVPENEVYTELHAMREAGLAVPGRRRSPGSSLLWHIAGQETR